MIYNERGLNTLHFCLDTPITFIPQQSSISYNTSQQHSTEPCNIGSHSKCSDDDCSAGDPDLRWLITLCSAVASVLGSVASSRYLLSWRVSSHCSHTISSRHSDCWSSSLFTSMFIKIQRSCLLVSSPSWKHPLALPHFNTVSSSKIGTLICKFFTNRWNG